MHLILSSKKKKKIYLRAVCDYPSHNCHVYKQHFHDISDKTFLQNISIYI